MGVSAGLLEAAWLSACRGRGTADTQGLGTHPKFLRY